MRLSVVSGGVSQLIRPAETKLTLPDIFQSLGSRRDGGRPWKFFRQSCLKSNLAGGNRCLRLLFGGKTLAVECSHGSSEE